MILSNSSLLLNCSRFLGPAEGLIFGRSFSTLALKRITMTLRYECEQYLFFLSDPFILISQVAHCLVDFCVEQAKFESPLGLIFFIMIIYLLLSPPRMSLS
jgi:hypothetical protein